MPDPDDELEDDELDDDELDDDHRSEDDERRVPPIEYEGERLQKVMARAGLGSRRVSEDLIAEGRVKVNGEVAELGRRVDVVNDRIEVDGALIG
ncbi:MAG: S4 domain-containing protein, partial [Acidimicrobiales bacterium]